MPLRRTGAQRISKQFFNSLPGDVRSAIVKAEDDILMERWDEVYPCTGVNGYCAVDGRPRPDAKPSRIWFYKPRTYFGNWSPVSLGGDEWCRLTVVLGWSFTGQAVIALRVHDDC